jgi:hypothetical protein
MHVLRQLVENAIDDIIAQLIADHTHWHSIEKAAISLALAARKLRYLTESRRQE